jgi:glutathione synthase/RimK-type ligase-like ATP-grasp enzyme
MARIGVFIERYTISRSDEMEALMRFSMIARKMGHEADYLFRPDIIRIPQYDAIFIRALTDPLNTSYVVARTAELHGKRVIDDAESIRVCCDKVNMYQHLMRDNVPMPDTLFVDVTDLNRRRGAEVLEELGSPLVLKAPNSSFSLYVEKVETPDEFMKVGNRFLRRSDRLVAQKFIKSDFDWRVGLIGGEVLYVCQYTIPRKRWKILTYTENNKVVYGPVKGVPVDKADPQLLDVARRAAEAIGTGLYGVDLKQTGDGFVVIEVNDNPTINAGEEDQAAGDLYEKVIRYLVEGRITP